jgi:hypothetical protein
MERDDMLDLFRVLSEGYLSGEMNASIYARTIEGLVSSNLDTVPDLEEIGERLSDFGLQGAVNPLSELDLRGIAERLIDLGKKEAGK